MRDLVKAGCVKKIKDGVLLVKGGGHFAAKAHLQVTETTPEAAHDVLAAGGKVTLAWYNKLGLRALLKPEVWAKEGLPLPRWARPPPKFERRYPQQNQDGVFVRVLDSAEAVSELDSAWRRIIHKRAAKVTV